LAERNARPATHELFLRPARKKSSPVFVNRFRYRPMPMMNTKYSAMISQSTKVSAITTSSGPSGAGTTLSRKRRLRSGR